MVFASLSKDGAGKSLDTGRGAGGNSLGIGNSGTEVASGAGNGIPGSGGSGAGGKAGFGG